VEIHHGRSPAIIVCHSAQAYHRRPAAGEHSRLKRAASKRYATSNEVPAPFDFFVGNATAGLNVRSRLPHEGAAKLNLPHVGLWRAD